MSGSTATDAPREEACDPCCGGGGRKPASVRRGRLPIRRRAGGLLLALSAALGLFGPVVSAPGASAAAPFIQPGELVETRTGTESIYCTLNFVYNGVGALAGRVYVGTAAHCVGRVGNRSYLSDGTSFGRVALVGDEDVSVQDYAFIEVDAAQFARVRASVKGHSAYPKGVTSASETLVGDVVVQSGYGMGFDLAAATRESRKAVLAYDDAGEAGIVGAAIFGDSGGPLVHEPTGKALGLVSRACLDGSVCEEQGPTIQGALAKAALRGFTVVLRRA